MSTWHWVDSSQHRNLQLKVPLRGWRNGLALTLLPENPSSFPRSSQISVTPVLGRFSNFVWHSSALHTSGAWTYRQNTQKHKMKIILRENLNLYNVFFYSAHWSKSCTWTMHMWGLLPSVWCSAGLWKRSLAKSMCFDHSVIQNPHI